MRCAYSNTNPLKIVKIWPRLGAQQLPHVESTGYWILEYSSQDDATATLLIYFAVGAAWTAILCDRTWRSTGVPHPEGEPSYSKVQQPRKIQPEKQSHQNTQSNKEESESEGGGRANVMAMEMSHAGS